MFPSPSIFYFLPDSFLHWGVCGSPHWSVSSPMLPPLPHPLNILGPGMSRACLPSRDRFLCLLNHWQFSRCRVWYFSGGCLTPGYWRAGPGPPGPVGSPLGLVCLLTSESGALIWVHLPWLTSAAPWDPSTMASGVGPL